MLIMLIPTVVINELNRMCRKFLWEGHLNGQKIGYVNWKQICTTKKLGGLGVRDLGLWNKLAIGKVVWQIAEKKDNLWFRWIHSVYVKNKDGWIYECTTCASWIWRRVCQIKGFLKKKAYKTIIKVGTKVPWDSIVWNKITVPKHRFLLWLVVLNMLQVKQRLCRHGVCEDDLCCICSRQEETHKHIFFECELAKGYVRALNLGLILKYSLSHWSILSTGSGGRELELVFDIK
ncbi:hypothetical protein RDABS01_008995 [Bienertia sinuspersici]